MMEKEFSSINDNKSHIQQHKKAQSGMTQRIEQWRGEVEEATTLRDVRTEPPRSASSAMRKLI